MSIVNRVAESGLIQFDPATIIEDMAVSVVSISDFLNDELILREKPFRQAIATHDWTEYTGKYVAIQIDEATLVPQWATMLLTCKQHCSPLRDQCSLIDLYCHILTSVFCPVMCSDGLTKGFFS